MNQSPANELTQRIIKFFYEYNPRIFAFRQNTLPIPITRGGQVVGFRPPPTTGIPDIQAIIPRGVSAHWPSGSGALFVEVKIPPDKIRDSQRAFHANARAGGDAIIIVVKDFEDFIKQFEDFIKQIKDYGIPTV